MTKKNKTPRPGRDSGVNQNVSSRTPDNDNNISKSEPRLTKSKPRDRRCLLALATNPGGIMRDDLDRAVGTSNSPQYVMHRRLEGWDVTTDRPRMIDRDGGVTHPGRYHMTPAHCAIARRILGVADD
jgi:hypothetical protein